MTWILLVSVNGQASAKLTPNHVNTKDPQLMWAEYHGYNSWTMTTQYTIHSVPDTVDDALHRLAEQGSKSINAVAIEALARGLELNAAEATHNDLDSLIGTWQEDAAFEQAIADLERTHDVSQLPICY
jgi:predicted transcriptional regulator